MSQTLIISIIVIYFGALMLIAYFTSKNADSDAFFSGNKQSPWYLVAFGMLGTSISGLTFISVPGNVGKIGFAYYQVVLGYLIGYWVIGAVLMPMYYRLNLVSIYVYLEQRFGYWSYKTGSSFFLLSRTIGSSLRLYLAASVLQLFLFDAWGMPFWVTVTITILLIWIYTFRGGVKTIIWTDSFQTLFLVSSVIISVILISNRLELSLPGMIEKVYHSHLSDMFYFDDYKSKLFFPKYFFGGAVIAIAMTGLDQDLMQKNLTCKNIGEAQKNMFWFTIVTTIITLLFLVLGALLYLYSDTEGIPIPASSDDLFPTLALHEFGMLAGIFFLLGIIASSYASADSALTALTTSFCIDFLNFNAKPEAVKKKEKFYVHIGVSLIFLIIIIIFRKINERSLIDAVLNMAGYTYGPLVGLYAFGLYTKKKLKDSFVPFVCIVSPILTYIIGTNSKSWLNGYQFSFEIIVLNAFISFVGLWLISEKEPINQ
ncbi:MAG TPA: sodium:solute symporter [Cytophagaceae bacterium]|jgi:Na+/proline symporter|nr:sodium:solute symporter [Cytophagaceae bacterium]